MSQRRPKDRSHWGDAAFKAMHDKPITGEVLHKALQEPTARELVDSILIGVVRTGYDGPDGISKDEALERSCILAARVEAVRTYIEEDQSPSAERMSLIRHIRRILDGEKP